MTERKSDLWPEYLKPIVVLVAICLVISAALAFTNDFTAPAIAKAAKETAESARLEVLPEADSFELLELSNLPETITAVYAADNGAGYVFMITCDGYGGAGTMNLICGINADGLITACKTLSHKETAGLGSKTAEADFKNQFIGSDASLSGVDAITGATISSGYYISAVGDTFAAFKIAQEAQR